MFFSVSINLEVVRSSEKKLLTTMKKTVSLYPVDLREKKILTIDALLGYVAKEFPGVRMDKIKLSVGTVSIILEGSPSQNSKRVRRDKNPK